MAAGHTDPAVLSVIEHSIAFFERGVAPPKGLDEIDRLLMRKRNMMQARVSSSSRPNRMCRKAPGLLIAKLQSVAA